MEGSGDHPTPGGSYVLTGGEGAGASFTGTLTPLLMTPQPPKAPLPNTITLGTRFFNTWIWWGHKHSEHSSDLLRRDQNTCSLSLSPQEEDRRLQSRSGPSPRHGSAGARIWDFAAPSVCCPHGGTISAA